MTDFTCNDIKAQIENNMELKSGGKNVSPINTTYTE